MIFKLRTSKQTLEIFNAIELSTNLQPFILAKLAIALSVASPNPLEEADFKTNTEGLELNRQTITGDHDNMFKALITNEYGAEMTEEEYFPKYLKAHLDRGAKLLNAEFRYSRNLLEHLCKLNKGL